MVRIRVIFASGLLFFASLSADAQTTLHVNAATGNDAVTRAQNSASSPWRSIGRAAWGSTSRNAPNANEAARAGDTVNVAGGTYVFTGSVSNRFIPVYNTVNAGTASSPITFACIGDCTLIAGTADSPVIGTSARNYVKWFADVGQGYSWIIPACGRQSGCGADVVNTTADTGPVVCHDATGCWVEGTVIDGGPGIDFADNWNAFRIENCTSCTIRNNTAANFTREGGSNHNQSIVTMYGSRDSVIEHNVGTNSGAGVYLKDTASTNPQSGNIIRFNRFDRVNEVFAFSVTGENRNFIYQNVGTNGILGLGVTSGGLSNDWIFNNSFYRMAMAAVATNQYGSGGRFWNNVCLECDSPVYVAGAPMMRDTVLDLEHNVYFGHRIFYTGSEASRSFASFKSTYPDQEQAAPASVEGNPFFVNAAGGDFRLCTGAAAPAASCAGTSAAIGRGVDLYDLDGDGNTTETIRAGAYVTNTEFIGLATAVPSAPTNLRISGGGLN